MNFNNRKGMKIFLAHPFFNKNLKGKKQQLILMFFIYLIKE